MLIPELDVLKPIDPSISNSDHYQQFVLSNVQVYDAKTGEPASLLHAYADTPLTVHGRLEPPERHQQQYFLSRPYAKAVNIEVKNVTRYAYGQSADTGEIVLWALGESGWLEIRPARVYKEIYQDMAEAVQLLYFASDVYSAPRKRGGGPSAELLFQEYAEDDRFLCNDRAETMELFYKHRIFLFMAMLTRAQGLGWSNTPFYQHMRHKFPIEFQALRDKISGKGEHKPASTRIKSKVVAPVDEAPKRVERSSKSQTKSAKSQKPNNAPKKDENWWEATAIWELMQKTFTQASVEHEKVTTDNVARAMMKKYKIEDREQAENYIRVHASNLRYMMQHPKRRGSIHFLSEPIFEELSSIRLPAATIRTISQMELRPRKSPAKYDISDDESDTASFCSDQSPHRGQHGRKGKSSVLRPKSSKVAGKGKGGKGGRSNSSSTPIDEDLDEIQGAISEPMEVSSPSKRKGSDDSTLLNPRKRTASRSNDLDSPPTSPSSDTTDTPSDPLPLRWKRSGPSSAKADSPALLPAIISNSLPSYAANGPGDSFICTFDGCVQKIYGASTAAGKMHIKDHFQQHAARPQQQLELVMSEEQRSRLPVNNLIKRIREMADHQQSLFPVPVLGMASAPSPIDRRY
ncbi:hypothetical protein K432DRAFT_350207 [Lepidopterella palustris CBS 459.81]|uniref:Uncharacterized protein n=1 Tax=Lepidopterella palustris CBS 459.81 TaxID=1314670 RepID=A0A8E2JGK5_9PEZI|nr:hypothetical protein K432DRAFT_350207 [Lepidopterella palustris CBS 459.81]